MELTKSIIRADIIAAKQAIEYFDQKGTKEIKNIAAYHLQQAAEKLIKYQIYQVLKSTDNHRMYTHDLSRLLDYAEAEGLTLIVPDYIRNHVNQITDWEAGSRYDFSFVCRIDTLKKCYETVKEWETKV